MAGYLKFPTRRQLWLTLFALPILFPLVIVASLQGAEIELRPGDTVGPHNWEKIKGMAGENFIARVKGGYQFQIKESQPRRLPREYLEATEKHAVRVMLGARGELLNYAAGIPFVKIDSSDAQAGVKLAWNFFYRWRGDDYKEGGGTATGRATSHNIEKDGSERRSEVVRHEIRTRGRVTLEPRGSIPGYEHIDWMIIRADEYPRDTAGTTTLEIRYVDPNQEDDLYIYVPNIRRVRRAPPAQRCATLPPTEFNYDDVNSFNGKVTNFNYRMLGRARMLGNLGQREVPFERRKGDYLPLREHWEILDAYVLEITPKDSGYCYPKKILYIEPQTFNAIWVMVSDSKGSGWKEQFNLYAPVKLHDGQEVLTTSSPVIYNRQNGRATVLATTRAYNQGYQPSLFTLTTLQTVMRGGAIR